MEQVNICATCKGWGVISDYGNSNCAKCQGSGIISSDEENDYIFGLPMFVDYKSRYKVKTIRNILIVFLFLVFIVILLSVLILIFVSEF